MILKGVLKAIVMSSVGESEGYYKQLILTWKNCKSLFFIKKQKENYAYNTFQQHYSTRVLVVTKYWNTTKDLLKSQPTL